MNQRLLEEKMAESGWDAVVVLSAENVFYLSGSPTALRFKSFQQTRPNSPRLVIVVQVTDGGRTLISSSLDERVNRAESQVDDVRSYREYRVSPVEMLAQVLKDTGLAKGRIGLEVAALGVTQHQCLIGLLPNACFEDCGLLMAEVRSIKTPEEIAIMKEAVDLMDDAFIESLASAHIGDTEASLHRRMMSSLTMRDFWPDQSGGTLAGERASDLFLFPSDDKRLEPGDIVRTDYVAAFRNYMANLSRVAVVGKPSPEQLDAYSKLLEVERVTAKSIRPGVAACDVFAYCHQTVLDLGLEHHLSLVGHNIGLDVHEDPMLVASDRRELKANMVICLEPVIAPYYHIQDEFLLTDTGTRLLSDKFNTDEIFVID